MYIPASFPPGIGHNQSNLLELSICVSLQLSVSQHTPFTGSSFSSGKRQLKPRVHCCCSNLPPIFYSLLRTILEMGLILTAPGCFHEN